jgi:site-specific recombinase XerD
MANRNIGHVVAKPLNPDFVTDPELTEEQARNVPFVFRDRIIFFPGREGETQRAIRDFKNLQIGEAVETIVATGEEVTLGPGSTLVKAQRSQKDTSVGSINVTDIIEKFISLHEKPTVRFYKVYLPKCFPPLTLVSKPPEINEFIKLRPCSPGGQDAYARALRAFFKWVYSPRSECGFRFEDSPHLWIDRVKVPKRILPSQTQESVGKLIRLVQPPPGKPLNGRYLRNMLLVALFINTGGRLSAIANIKEEDILWSDHMVKTIEKGDQEVLMPTGDADTEALLRAWISEHRPNPGETIWGITKSGIVDFFRRLEKKAGFKTNPHTFRRGFASILRAMGVSKAIIQTIGHWKTGVMVDHYSESVSAKDVQQHYQAPVAVFQSAALPTELPRREDSLYLRQAGMSNERYTVFRTYCTV